MIKSVTEHEETFNNLNDFGMSYQPDINNGVLYIMNIAESQSAFIINKCFW